MAAKKVRNRLALTPKKYDLEFFHKNSQVNYDPVNRHYRATFDFSFEMEVYGFIDSFLDLLFSDNKFRDFGALPSDRNMTGLYMSMLRDFNNVNWEDYSKWYYGSRARLYTSLKAITVNIIDCQRALKIKDLEFLGWASYSALLSALTEEYFHRHFEKVNIMRETITHLIGLAFEGILTEIYKDSELGSLRNEKTGADKRKFEPFTGRYVSVFNDIAEQTNVEKMVFSRDERVFLDRQCVNGLMEAFSSVLKKSRRVCAGGGLREIMAEPQLIKNLLYDRRDRRHFASIIKKDRQLKEKLVTKAEAHFVLEAAREIVAETGSGPLMNIIRHPEYAEELFTEPKVKKYITGALKGIGGQKANSLLRRIQSAESRVKRSRNRYINNLTGKEYDDAVYTCIDNFTLYHKIITDFASVRRVYGKKSGYSEDFSGLKLLRQGGIKSMKPGDFGGEIEAFMAISDEQKTRIMNTYEEGGVFYFRQDGAIYPGEQGNIRGKKFFMFADLRNSTETTMKLTKDTASFLTPYLNTVYRISKANNGSEIYFAGDGYAAHFSGITDCLRAAHQIHGEFARLRRDAEMKLADKEKAIAKELVKLGVIDPASGKATGKQAAREGLGEEIAEAAALIAPPRKMPPAEAIAKTAAEYSMPRVEIGIGITEGELFFAVIGEEENVRFNIVLSPSLTQAARLSGSDGAVKTYLEKVYGLKNIPRKVFVHEKKLFNQGVVITGEVFNALRREVEVKSAEAQDTKLTYKSLYYYDSTSGKYMAMSKMDSGVNLKGIENEVEIFECFAPGSEADTAINRMSGR